ncbi:hypothetical protein FGO68_gene6748 [Halteria grandinella]|uniref:Uncharacterized protein n=1 Tax=Halteria grandinella TaxID=5974 RepID=A0A8J8T7Z2_HALGN|nr:hypothetical protein FGO68_gene6748 [Halteria grandinella]
MLDFLKKIKCLHLLKGQCLMAAEDTRASLRMYSSLVNLVAPLTILCAEGMLMCLKIPTDVIICEPDQILEQSSNIMKNVMKSGVPKSVASMGGSKPIPTSVASLQSALQGAPQNQGFQQQVDAMKYLTVDRGSKNIAQDGTPQSRYGVTAHSNHSERQLQRPLETPQLRGEQDLFTPQSATSTKTLAAKLFQVISQGKSAVHGGGQQQLGKHYSQMGSGSKSDQFVPRSLKHGASRREKQHKKQSTPSSKTSSTQIKVIKLELKDEPQSSQSHPSKAQQPQQPFEIQPYSAPPKMLNQSNPLAQKPHFRLELNMNLVNNGGSITNNSINYSTISAFSPQHTNQASRQHIPEIQLIPLEQLQPRRMTITQESTNKQGAVTGSQLITIPESEGRRTRVGGGDGKKRKISSPAKAVNKVGSTNNLDRSITRGVIATHQTVSSPKSMQSSSVNQQSKLESSTERIKANTSQTQHTQQIGPMTQTIIECLNRLQNGNNTYSVLSPQHTVQTSNNLLRMSINSADVPPSVVRSSFNDNTQQPSQLPAQNAQNTQNAHQNAQQHSVSQQRQHNYTAILQDLMARHTRQYASPHSGSNHQMAVSSVERKMWTDIKNLNDLNQSEKHLPLEHRFTLSQKIAFQLEEQLQLAFQENQKIQRELEQEKYRGNRQEDELYVARKQLEQKDSVIEALSIRYDSEYSKFEDKIHQALYDKDLELQELSSRLASQQMHSDELEKELDKMSRERLLQERLLREAISERDQSRKNIAELQNQAQEYLSQLNEYKHIIQRMSAMRSGGGSSLSQHNISAKHFHGGSTDDLIPHHGHAKSVSDNQFIPVIFSTQARSPPPQEMDQILEENQNINTGENNDDALEFSSEVILIQENQKLKKKLAQLKKVMLSDKNLKQMKLEVLEVLSLLDNIEDYLNQQRGIIKEDDFLLSNFEDKFLREFNLEMEAEVITVLDLNKVKKKAQIVQRLLLSQHVEKGESPSLGSSIKYKKGESSSFLTGVGGATNTVKNEQDWLRYLQGGQTSLNVPKAKKSKQGSASKQITL